MRFLVDENLPRRLVPWLKDKGADAIHVLDLDLADAPDATLWGIAEPSGAYIMTRDSDFLVIAAAAKRGGVVHLRMGQCTSAQMFERLEAAWTAIARAVDAGQRIVEVR
jgi:predicted nuclease of predicted toxin-antitoxin system